MPRADDLAGEPSEFVCTDAPPPCDDPNGTPEWQRAKELGAAINEPGRKQRVQQLKRARARTADPTARMVLAAHVQDTQHQLAQDRALLRGVAPAQARRPRVARPRGAGRPRARTRRTTSSRAGPSDDPGEGEGGGDEPPPPVLYLVHETLGRVNRPMAALLRRLGQ